MTDTLDRDALIALLTQLGDASDEKALTTARQIHALVDQAGHDWDTLLTNSEDADTGGADSRDADTDVDDLDEEEPEETPMTPAPSKDDKQTQAMIAGLLVQSDISAFLREELEGYKKDIAESEFEDADRAYLFALKARLSKGK